MTAKTDNPEREAAKIRRMSAELELLHHYSDLRSRRGYNYGGGQVRAEISRRRRELDSAAGYRRPLISTPTTAELIEAWQKIGRPRAARARYGSAWVELLWRLLREYGLVDEPLAEVMANRMLDHRVELEPELLRLERECERLRDGTPLDRAESPKDLARIYAGLVAGGELADEAEAFESMWSRCGWKLDDARMVEAGLELERLLKPKPLPALAHPRGLRGRGHTLDDAGRPRDVYSGEELEL